jgi:hypothetical protein
MGKRLKLATRAFGAEPGMPDVAALAAWITNHRGETADILTYQLDQSLAPQIPAGIQVLCAGGAFYGSRILAALGGVVDRKVTGEIHVDLAAIIEDAAGIVVRKKGAWCAIPAPHVLTIKDFYYHDTEEWNDALCGAYRTIMRSMRDTGVAGNVLICDTIDSAELLALSRQNVFFFQRAQDRESLAGLMEHQRQIAVWKTHLMAVFDLMNEYTLQKLFIVDPDPASITLALSHLDPDQVSIGGYCTETCGTYWKNQVDTAVYSK